MLFGAGIVNDKGPMAAFLISAKAVKAAGAELRGDLLPSAVPGEIGHEAVDEFEAPYYLSKEVGTRYLIQHGGVADFALVAEGTDFRYAAIDAGKAFFKITVFGEDQYYTPFVPDAEVDSKHPNAIVRAALPELPKAGGGDCRPAPRHRSICAPRYCRVQSSKAETGRVAPVTPLSSRQRVRWPGCAARILLVTGAGRSGRLVRRVHCFGFYR